MIHRRNLTSMIIYKTVNLINGKFYIGQDFHNDPTYLGSGKILHLAFKKYGIENFKKEILEYCQDKKTLDEREIFWIKEFNSTNREIGYNIALGGEGGDTYTNNPNKGEISKKRQKTFKDRKISFSNFCVEKATEGRKRSHPGYGTDVDENSKKDYQRKHSNKIKQFYAEHGHWDIGRKRSEIACENIGASKRGEKHPNFGKHLSDSLKEKISDSCKRTRKERKIFPKFSLVECPHCNKIGKGPIMKRWHFNNCKKRVF